MLNCKIVIGSWGSYTECNERALGSSWLDLSDYDSWDEIREELTRQGFELEGIDAELFVQDIESDIDFDFNCDAMHPATLFNLLKESEILTDNYKFRVAAAYMEVNGFEDWAYLVEEYGDCWDDDITLWRDMDMVEVAEELIHNCYDLPEFAERYFDYEAFARDLSYDGYYDTSYGVLEI